jgi:dTDP-4-amino-4,6-dideoxygalactose transaminase
MINVTKTFLPPLAEYMAQVERAYKNAWLTNRGELVRELEEKVSHLLGLTDSKMICMNNGTIPLQIALKLLAKGGEVITTPFSYVATTASIVWENCTPVFVDIHPEYLTIDETLIEAAITDRTTCILATHVFGNPCNIEEIERIAKKHGLQVIYDAAHCFGVNYNGKSIFEYGDVSTCSFHATKLFHTAEGGAAFCRDTELFHKLFYSHNFGHNGPVDFHGLGINAKVSELQGAMGLSVLPHMQHIHSERKRVVDYYITHLNVALLKGMKLRENTDWNYSYYPIVFKSEDELLRVDQELKKNGVTVRRYFYPSLNSLNYVANTACPISESIASRIVCLPLYVGLTDEQLQMIVRIINDTCLSS